MVALNNEQIYFTPLFTCKHRLDNNVYLQCSNLVNDKQACFDTREPKKFLHTSMFKLLQEPMRFVLACQTSRVEVILFMFTE